MDICIEFEHEFTIFFKINLQMYNRLKYGYFNIDNKVKSTTKILNTDSYRCVYSDDLCIYQKKEVQSKKTIHDFVEFENPPRRLFIEVVEKEAMETMVSLREYKLSQPIGRVERCFVMVNGMRVAIESHTKIYPRQFGLPPNYEKDLNETLYLVIECEESATLDEFKGKLARLDILKYYLPMSNCNDWIAKIAPHEMNRQTIWDSDVDVIAKPPVYVAPKLDGVRYDGILYQDKIIVNDNIIRINCWFIQMFFCHFEYFQDSNTFILIDVFSVFENNAQKKLFNVVECIEMMPRIFAGLEVVGSGNDDCIGPKEFNVDLNKYTPYSDNLDGAQIKSEYPTDGLLHFYEAGFKKIKPRETIDLLYFPHRADVKANSRKNTLKFAGEEIFKEEFPEWTVDMGNFVHKHSVLEQFLVLEFDVFPNEKKIVYKMVRQKTTANSVKNFLKMIQHNKN